MDGRNCEIGQKAQKFSRLRRAASACGGLSPAEKSWAIPQITRQLEAPDLSWSRNRVNTGGTVHAESGDIDQLFLLFTF